MVVHSECFMLPCAGGLMNDFWVLKGVVGGEENPCWQLLELPGEAPTPRKAHTMAGLSLRPTPNVFPLHRQIGPYSHNPKAHPPPPRMQMQTGRQMYASSSFPFQGGNQNGMIA